MTMEISPAIGLCFIVLGGISQALFMLPAKWCKGWKFEHIWLIFSIFCYLILPWLIVLASVPGAGEILAATSGHDLVMMGVYGTGWALASLTFGIGVSMLGVSVGFALIFGISAFVGALLPLFAAHGELAMGKLLAILVSLGLMLTGVILCSLAGKWRETSESASSERGRYFKGLLVCVASGLFGATGNMGFVAGTGMVAIGRARGLSAFATSSLLLAYLCLFLFLLNAGYSLILVWRNDSFSVFLPKSHARYFVFSMLMSFFWMAGFIVYVIGARAMGTLGLSLGWGVFMCTIVASANVIGVLSGEWRSAPTAAKRRLGIGVSVLVIAIVGLAASNALM
jgi:L-rhamnose-H+ transport protein